MSASELRTWIGEPSSLCPRLLFCVRGFNRILIGDARLGLSNLRNAGLSGPLNVGFYQMRLVMTPEGPAMKVRFGTILLSDAIKAAYILQRIMPSIDLEAVRGDTFDFTFSCGVDVHDVLCEFGTATDDKEDDDSDEDDGCAECDGRRLDRTLPEPEAAPALAA